MKKTLAYVIGLLLFMGQYAYTLPRFSFIEDLSSLPEQRVQAIQREGFQEMLTGAAVVITFKAPKYIWPHLETEEDQIFSGMFSPNTVAGLGAILFLKGTIKTLSVNVTFSQIQTDPDPVAKILLGGMRVIFLGGMAFMHHHSLSSSAPGFMRELYQSLLGPSLYYWSISTNLIGGVSNIWRGVQELWWGRGPNRPAVAQNAH